jgi:phosphoribosylamine--glycine ligase
MIGPIIDNVLAELDDFRGTLFGGLMLTDHGAYVLEFNIRFGDPETQSIVLRLDSDLAQLLADAAAGKTLPKTEVGASGACVTVVLASEGYPENPTKGDVITGIDEQGKFVTAGGRVLNVTATADTIERARELAYQAVGKIHWRGMQYRSDIAKNI